jgi:hypothetical protein
LVNTLGGVKNIEKVCVEVRAAPDESPRRHLRGDVVPSKPD